MNPESIFRFCNTLALLSWILLIALGWKKWVPAVITGAIVPLSLGIIYLALLAFHWGEGRGGFNTLAEVAALFSNAWLLLAGWVHYLAFDLFIGSWQVRNAARNGISHWLVVPCLIFTFLFGPVGLILYFGLRFALRRRFAIAEEGREAARTY